MATIPLLPCDADSKAIFLSNKELPLNYMGDFSLLGFVVDSYSQAQSLLISAGYYLDEQRGGADIYIDSPLHITMIRDLLAANSITCDYTDIVDTLYQA